MTDKKEDSNIVWIVIIIVSVLIGLWALSSLFTNTVDDESFESNDESAYVDSHNEGNDIVTEGKSSRDVKFCSDQCVLTNDVCVAFVGNGMEWRDCGLNCNCPEILQECYGECEELFG